MIVGNICYLGPVQYCPSTIDNTSKGNVYIKKIMNKAQNLIAFSSNPNIWFPS